MIAPLDLERMANRVEHLQFTRTHDWHPADALEFRNALPGSHGHQTLPYPQKLKEMARSSTSPSDADWRMWTSLILRMEGIKSQNDPRNPRRIIRDMIRGKIPLRYGSALMADPYREKLAAEAHAAWSGWMAYLFSHATSNDDGTVTIPAWAVERWRRQLSTPYHALSPEEQESDRREADRYLAIMQK